MNIKKGISALLITVVLILSITIMPVSAVSDNEINVQECETYVQKMKYDFMSTGVKRPYAGYYYSHSNELADELITVASEYKSGKATADELQNKYDETKDFYENPWIRPDYAGYTCYIAVNEKNYNNWYYEGQWNTFVEKRENLVKSLSVNHPDFVPKEYGEGIEEEEYTLEQQKYISKCFYELLEIYNEMTCGGIVLGDVNKDGFVNVADVTLIQKYIAGEAEFTDAQKLRARVNCDSYSVSIKDSTTVQKCIAGYTDAYFYPNGVVKNERDFATSLDNWQICCQF